MRVRSLPALAAACLATAVLALGACQKPAEKPSTPGLQETASDMKPAGPGVQEIRSTSSAAGAELPSGTTSLEGKVATISLPFRTASGKMWVVATRTADAAPFSFKGLDVKPGAGPDGTDLAVFTYEADKAGSATLKFGLVPGGKMLIGPDALVYKGPVDKRYETTVTAQ